MTVKPIVKLLVIATLIISTASCRKDREETMEEIETTFEISESQAKSDNIDQDAGDVAEEAVARLGFLGFTNPCGTPTMPSWIGSCAIITETGSFPTKNITVDFGAGCTSPNGKVRKGIISILMTDSLYKPGSIATITFNNYFVNNNKREGTIVRTNTTQVGSAIFSHNRTVTNGKITKADGKIFTHSCNINFTQTAGTATPCDFTDDIFSIDGTRTTTNANGKTRTATTQIPLQKKMSCSNIDQGILNVQGPKHNAIIDFGNGACDNQATISINGRPARTITLK
jgi:hypothetical protein